MCDRDPIPQWTFGRVTLLGDAAHPMYPVGSNGASQAVLDARCWPTCWLEHDDPRAALKAYEAERVPVTTEIVETNRKGGPERVIDVVTQRAPDGFDKLEDVASRKNWRPSSAAIPSSPASPRKTSTGRGRGARR